MGTKPIIVGKTPLKQTFWAHLGRAQIVIVGQVVPKIEVMINGKKHEFPISKSIFQKDVKIDISRFIEDGENVIVYSPAFSSPYTLLAKVIVLGTSSSIFS